MRRLAWFCGGFGAACLLSCYGGGGWIAAATGALLLLFALLVRQVSGRAGAFFQVSRRAVALLLGGTLAFLWFSAYSALFYAPAQKLAGTEQTLSATVLTYPQTTSIGGRSVTVALDGGLRSPHALIYGSEDWVDLRPGDEITCTVRLKAADTLYGNETAYYSAKGVFLLGYCDEAPAVTRPERVSPRHWPRLCAQYLREGIHAAFGEDAPLAAAVTLGDKEGLSTALYSDLSRAGITHTAVVSGMHISILVSFFLLLVRGRRSAALWAIPFLLFYALMAGGTPSAIRAVIMQAALLAGPVLGREPDPPTSLGLALFVLLLQNPFAAASVSLQLSFAAVAGILAVTGPMASALMEPLRRRLRGYGFLPAAGRGIGWFFISSLTATLGALLFTTPLTVLYFGQINLISPLTNLLTLWAVTVLMVSALIIGTLAVFFPGIMAVPGAVFGLLARYISAVVSTAGRWTFSALDGTRPLFLLWLAALYLALPLVYFARRRGIALLLAAVCLTGLLGGAVFLHRQTDARADLTVTVLDVGQGASTLLTGGGQAVLVDCGGNSARDPGDIAADRLAAMGRHRLDALVFTHLDDDHFNGAELLFRRLDIGAVYLPEGDHDPANLALLQELAAAEGIPLRLITRTETLSVGEAALTLYPPLGGGTSNEAGLFALCSHGEFDVLITGDADVFVEEMLVKYHPLPDIELLLAGHHGSRHSTSPLLLEILRPELAVISVGYNAYGHPAEETLDRLAAAGVTVYRTDQRGTVTVALRAGNISLS